MVNGHLYTHHLDSTFCNIRFLTLSVCLVCLPVCLAVPIYILSLLNFLKLSCRCCYISLLNTSTLDLVGLRTSST